MKNKDFSEEHLPMTSENTRITRRHLFKKGGLLGAISAVFSIFPFSAPAQAAANNSPSLNITEYTGSDAERYIQPVLQSTTYQQFKLDAQNYSSYSFSVSDTQAKVWIIESDGTQSLCIRIPVSSNDKTDHGFYFALLDQKTARILTTKSSLLVPATGTDIHAIGSLDGRTVIDAIMTTQGHVLQGTLSPKSGSSMNITGLAPKQIFAKAQSVHPDFFSWCPSNNICCIVDGLVIAGVLSIPAAIIIVAICGTACAATLGFGCVVCVGAAGVFGGTILGGILYQCSHNSCSFLGVVC